MDEVEAYFHETVAPMASRFQKRPNIIPFPDVSNYLTVINSLAEEMVVKLKDSEPNEVY